MHALSPLRVVICLPCFLVTPSAFFVSIHLCTVTYMFMNESCLLVSLGLVPSGTLLDGMRVSSILQHNGTMDTRFKPTFVLLGHHLLFDNIFSCPFVCLACLFAPVWPFLLVCSLHAFYLSFYLLCFFLCLSAGLFPCLLHVQAWSKGLLERGNDLLGTSKKGKDVSMKT